MAIWLHYLEVFLYAATPFFPDLVIGGDPKKVNFNCFWRNKLVIQVWVTLRAKVKVKV